ncbi:MAG: purine-nucleoside phosphorylase [Pirellulaceae bacterium]|nr:purine-nucleoside phosphorylase [Pirellulaceae bacterium]
MTSNFKQLNLESDRSTCLESDGVREATEHISTQRLLQPQVAIILGSGLGGLANDVQHPTCIPYHTVPHFRATNAVGHAGQLILGFLSGVPVVVMQGRYHRYEGHSNQDVCFPVRVMHDLGAKTLIVTNAAGGLNPRYRPGDLMLVDQHIDCLWPRTSQSEAAYFQPTASNSQAHTVSLRQAREIYDQPMLQRVRRIALKHELPLHRGTYIATLGPTYETRAEYRMFRWMGGDAVGMSTVPEVLTARQLGMNVLAMSVITNVACTDQAQSTSHAEVVQCGQQVEPQLRKIVGQLLEEMAGPAD